MPTHAETDIGRLERSPWKRAGGANDVFYRVLVGDVQSVVQPVNGQAESCTASSTSRLIDHLGGFGDGRSASTPPCGADCWRSLLASCVEGDPVDSVT